MCDNVRAVGGVCVGSEGCVIFDAEMLSCAITIRDGTARLDIRDT